MYCPRCGENNQDESKVCKRCGGSLALIKRLAQTNIQSASETTLRKPARSLPTVSPPPVARALPPRPHQTIKPHPSEIKQKTEQQREGSTLASQLQKLSKEEAPDLPRSTDASQPAEQMPVPPKRQPPKAKLIPTHELIRMANAFGIDVNYTTLRFWQKCGLVPKPVLGPISGKRGMRGYYDASMLDRLAFIRKTQKLGLDVEAIRAELNHLGLPNAQAGIPSPVNNYDERLSELQAQREVEEKKYSFTLLSQALGLDPEEIALIAIRKKDGRLVKIRPRKKPDDTPRRVE